ncbi:serine/threonine protein kinase [Nocardia huaxiensis]|uniref:Serine/threonine protein kinase n=1 Tax=Nocardia huaxiensis TaxID=2755382 RepID=A0A7D6ZIM4_9NOCA|nr:serine/threonine protein kinase [Nocardia huaxiensis]
MKALGTQDPAQLGDIRLLAVIGQGGMGRVLLGRTAAGRLVAVKRIHRHLAGDTEFRSRFQREVAAGRQVTGAYTAAVVEADIESEIPWLATEYMNGPPLSAVVADCGPLPLGGLRLLATGLAAALMEIHRAGLVHRDLTPGNVLLTAEGPRVIDFGIARAAEGSATLTATGSVLGSPAYMSPEQATGGEITPAADVFAVGAILALAAGGVAPFPGTTTPQVLYNVMYSAPELSALPPAVRELVAACLAKNPAERPTAIQLLDAAGRIPAEPGWPEPVRARIAAHRADTDWWVEMAAREARQRERLEALRHRRTRRLRWTAAGVAALAVIGGTAVAAGELAEMPGSPAAMVDPALALTATEARLLDTCALLEQAVAPAIGPRSGNLTTEIKSGKHSCSTSFTDSAGTKVGYSLSVDGYAEVALSSMEPVGVAAGWTAVLGDQFATRCQRAVVTPTRGQTRNSQAVITIDGVQRADGSCSDVQKALVAVVRQLTVRVPLRQHDRDSILSTDPCSVVDPERGRAIVGAPASMTAGLDLCAFGGVSVVANVALYEGPRKDAGAQGKVQVGRFTAYQEKGDSTCGLTYLVRPTKDNLAEQVSVYVNAKDADPTGSATRCEQAGQLLADTLEKLRLP